MVTQLSLLRYRSGSRAHLDSNRQQQLASCLINSLDLRLPLPSPLLHTHKIVFSLFFSKNENNSVIRNLETHKLSISYQLVEPVTMPFMKPKETGTSQPQHCSPFCYWRHEYTDRFLVTKAAALVWDAFPPPPPEAGDRKLEQKRNAELA